MGIRIKLAAFLSVILFCVYSTASSQEKEDNLVVNFTTTNKYAKSTTDFEEVDDARNFTSEAVFSESRLRLNRPLTDEELSNIARVKNQFESFNELKLNYKNFTTLALSYKYKSLSDAQITNFYKPNQFNDVKLDEYGIDLRKTIATDAYNFFVRASYKKSRREGIIEFEPSVIENINNYEVNMAFYRVIDEKALTVYPTYVFQDINQDISNPYERKRKIAAILFTYGNKINDGDSYIFRSEDIFERRFERRGLNLFGGIVSDIETYAETDVTKNDFFIGTTFRMGSFDLSIQPTIFTSKVEGDSSQDNSQYRTDVILYYQVNRNFYLAFPFKHDLAVKGPDYFENWMAGFELNYRPVKKWGILSPSVLARYSYQDFYKLDKRENLITISLSLNF